VIVTGADTPDGGAAARALSGTVGALVLCGRDPSALGTLAGELDGRVAVFVDDPGSAKGASALQELVDELFARG
jgi:NADP-dependent 3-hydroxy acid dehydrogenase YdfG